MNAKTEKNPVVSVVGLGLIGASIASALSEQYTVYGSDVDMDAVRFALNQKIIQDDARTHLKESDLILVATPVAATSATIDGLFKEVGDRVLISDVTSVKSSVIAALPKGIRFVGGHPMAGKEKGGIRSYSPALFENAVYVLTPTAETSEEDLQFMTCLVRVLGAFPIQTSPKAHDAAVSKISHMPHLIAYALANTSLDDPLAQELAAGAFRDMTRVAASDPQFWTEVAFSNRENILKDMRAFQTVFGQMTTELDEGNNTALRAAMSIGKDRHDRMNERSFGQTDVLFVGVEDKPMALAKITTLLGGLGVNITGLRIINSREGIGGALRLEFSSKDECGKAQQILIAHGYRAER